MIYLVGALVAVNLGLTYLVWKRGKGGPIAAADVRQIDQVSERLESLAKDKTTLGRVDD